MASQGRAFNVALGYAATRAYNTDLVVAAVKVAAFADVVIFSLGNDASRIKGENLVTN
jgi:hypothetical protein